MNAAPVAPTAFSHIENPDRLLEVLETDTHVVFDLDGTLFDPRDFERPALAAVAAWLRERSGRELPGAAAWLWSHRERDRHRRGLFDALLAAEGLPIAWGAECRERFHGYAGNELETAPSLRELLGQLRARGRTLALVTNGPPDLQRRKLEMLRLVNYFEVAIVCDPLEPGQLKPSPWAWSRLASWRGNSPVAHVGDDPVDAQFAETGRARFVPYRFRNHAHAD